MERDQPAGGGLPELVIRVPQVEAKTVSDRNFMAQKKSDIIKTFFSSPQFAPACIRLKNLGATSDEVAAALPGIHSNRVGMTLGRNSLNYKATPSEMYFRSSHAVEKFGSEWGGLARWGIRVERVPPSEATPTEVHASSWRHWCLDREKVEYLPPQDVEEETLEHILLTVADGLKNLGCWKGDTKGISQRIRFACAAVFTDTDYNPTQEEFTARRKALTTEYGDNLTAIWNMLWQRPLLAKTPRYCARRLWFLRGVFAHNDLPIWHPSYNIPTPPNSVDPTRGLAGGGYNLERIALVTTPGACQTQPAKARPKANPKSPAPTAACPKRACKNKVEEPRAVVEAGRPKAARARAGRGRGATKRSRANSAQRQAPTEEEPKPKRRKVEVSKGDEEGVARDITQADLAKLLRISSGKVWEPFFSSILPLLTDLLAPQQRATSGIR